MKLVIVESPAKAKTISKYLEGLSNGPYVVKASVGHVRDLPKSNKKALDIPAGFVPHYEISKGKESVVAEIKSLAKKADEVYLATDPDREGEAIAWHIKEAVGLKKPKRIVFHEITKEAIQEAVSHPRDIDENLKEAQEARRVLDRLVGYDLSGLIWKKVRYGLSAGRVQSPALRIIMEREREIRAFISHTYWIISADLTTEKNIPMTATCVEEPTVRADMERIVAYGKENKWKVASIGETEVKRAPRAPFITSTLQQAASSRLGFPPSRTMGIAQKLYEAGHITYMRTDSTNLSEYALSHIASVIGKKFGAEYHEAHVFAKKSKNAQEAHEAIRPTDMSKDAAGANEEQKRLYTLIWQRTVASQMKDARVMRTKIIAQAGEAGKIPDFAVNGSRIIFDGWLKADPTARGEDVEVPKVKEGEPLALIEMKTDEKETQPPPRYTEAGLVKELEKRGIGRPSTYASIIKTIVDRGYVEKKDRSLHPTDTGDVVSTFLEKNFTDYISDTFTAGMEDTLDSIARGESKYEATLKKFYTPFSKEVKEKSKTSAKITDLGPAPAEFTCPLCSSPMIIKLGKAGKFMSCKRFPDCTGARTIAGEVLEGPKETGEKCPECAEGMLVERDGRFGRFVACSRYPKCKYIKKDAALEKARSTGVACPVCKKGEMVEKRGRFGIFYGCSNYPECKNIIKSKPTGRICELCGALMMEGTKTIPERCSNKKCKMNRPNTVVK